MSDDPPPEPISIAPDLPGEGESKGSMQPRTDAQPIKGSLQKGKTSDSTQPISSDSTQPNKSSRLQKGKTSDSTQPIGSDSMQPTGTISDSTQSKKDSDSTQPSGTISDSLKGKKIYLKNRLLEEFVKTTDIFKIPFRMRRKI